ncbi:MAG: alpha/beta hydrolase [Oscillospiraceae bacterium]|nr:alpha/beta hydrolase [Oscillospiraceae bacterium]
MSVVENNYYIIHGSFGSPFVNWFSWLQDFIKAAEDSREVYVPQFPIGVGYQNYENWSNLLKYYLDLGLINETTTIIAHSIAPVFVSKFLIENKLKVKKLIFVCGFNNYFGINEEYDTVNSTMYLDGIEDVKQYANEVICFYSDNDPYVGYNIEKEFADKVGTKQILLQGAGHINSESGYDTFEEIVAYL